MLTFPRFGTSSPPLMIHLVYALLATARSSLRSRRELALENLALRQQLAVLKRSSKRPKLAKMDRAFWVALSRLSTAWQDILILVKPETVIGMASQRLRALVVPTATFRILYVFVVLEHERRSTSSETGTRSMAQPSFVERMRWESNRSSPRRVPRGRVRTASA